MIRVVIDHRTCELPGGGSVLDALRAEGIHLPALCHDDRIAPAGVCRTCLVTIDGHPKPVPACVTPIADGMEIETAGSAQQARHWIVRMLARRRRAAARQDVSHPYIAVDMERCIDCYRCVRICAELQGQFVWHVRGRGRETSIEPDGPTLRDSSCVSCGACVDTCPTGALEDRCVAGGNLPATWTRTVCPYCGVGCEVSVGTRGGRIAQVRPVLESPVSKGHLCVKGRYAFGYVSAPDRITEPMIRDRGGWRRVSWADARAFTAERLRTIIGLHGPDAVGMLASARATNEDNYVAQKFARAVIGTNNVDCCARVCHTPSAAALKRVFGAGFSTSSFDDIEAARTILVCGANPTENHPVVGARIKQAVLRGARLIVIDPRQIELAAGADVHLAIRPGTNIPVLNAIANTIVTEGLCDGSFIEQRVTGFDDFARAIHEWPAERAARLCGVDAEAIRRAARLYAGGGPALSINGLGLTEHVQGTEGVMALINLALLTGNVGRPGAGVNPLRGQNNVQGAAHMGCDPSLLPGSTPIAAGRAAFERGWGVQLPATNGLNALEMLDAAIDGRVRALWTTGWDLLMTNPNAAHTARALKSLDFFVVQDMFITETARDYGSVFLPACSSFEKDGTFMNAERRIQRVRPALRPAGSSKADWQIVCETADAMGGRGFSFSSPEEIWDEMRSLCEGGRGMTYARLDAGGLQWPCPSLDHPGTAILHAGAFVSGSRARLQPIEYRPSPETTSNAFPLWLITGRCLYQFNAATMSGRTPDVDLRPSDVLDISPVDAAAGTLDEGDRVRVISHYGSAVLPVHVTDAVAPGQLFATFHTPAVRMNAVTGPHRDSVVGTPEYKLTAVRVERVTGPSDAADAGA
jgi:formate dehydrogenase major subunit